MLQECDITWLNERESERERERMDLREIPTVSMYVYMSVQFKRIDTLFIRKHFYSTIDLSLISLFL